MRYSHHNKVCYWLLCNPTSSKSGTLLWPNIGRQIRKGSLYTETDAIGAVQGPAGQPLLDQKLEKGEKKEARKEARCLISFQDY